METAARSAPRMRDCVCKKESTSSKLDLAGAEITGIEGMKIELNCKCMQIIRCHFFGGVYHMAGQTLSGVGDRASGSANCLKHFCQREL